MSRQLTGLIIVWLVTSAGLALAQESQLTVRDVNVGFVAKNSMNDRTAFRSTLPGVVVSQRPVPPKPQDAVPQPLGVLTFEGTPTEKLDVLMEYDNSTRMLARWPHTDVRSSRTLWRKLDLLQTKDAPSTAFPANSWLNILRNADRLSLMQDKRLEKFILYDMTLRSTNTVELESADTGYKARNIGSAAIHDVTVYRPMGGGKYRAAYVKELPGQGSSAPPVVPAAADGTAPTQVSRAAQAEELKAKGLKVEAAAKAANAEDAVQVQVAVELEVKAQAINRNAKNIADQAAPAGVPATPAVAATPANTPQQDIIWASDAQTPAELLAGWEPLLAAQGLSAPEIAHVLAILRANAFDKDSARIVFRLDPSVIETLAPLEITPQPDQLIRVWLVILDGADPEIKTRISKMIANLGDPSYEKRMEAKAQLLKLGPTAVPVLNGEKGNKDAEISFRVEEILEEIQNPTDQGTENPGAAVEADEIFIN